MNTVTFGLVTYKWWKYHFVVEWKSTLIIVVTVLLYMTRISTLPVS